MTFTEAAEILEPPVTRCQVRALVAIAGIESCSRRRTGRSGRPALEFDGDAIRQAHAEEAGRTLKQIPARVPYGGATGAGLKRCVPTSMAKSA